MDFNNIIKLADSAIKNNKYIQAVKFLEDAIKIKPNSYDLHLKLGLLNQHLSNYKNQFIILKKV